MEVDGRGGTIRTDETEQVNLTCEPCENEGQQLEAEGFCENCQEYMCSDCLKYHRKAKLTKHHTVLDGSSMPSKEQKIETLPVCTESCQKHPEETIKFFCRDHNTVGCSDCMMLDHNQCKKKYVREIALSFIEGDDLKNLNRRIKDLKCRVTLAKKNITDEENAAGSLAEEAVQEIHGFLKELNKYLNEMGNVLLVKCTEIQSNNTKIVEEATEKLDLISDEIEAIESEVESKRDRPADLFVTAKKVEVQLEKAQDTIGQLSRNVELKKQRFIQSHAWRKLLGDSTVIGELRDLRDDPTTIVLGSTGTAQGHHTNEAPSEPTCHANSESTSKVNSDYTCKYYFESTGKALSKSMGEANSKFISEASSKTRCLSKMTPILVGNISVKSCSDYAIPCISSMALLHSGELICTDWKNYSLKVVDTKTGKILSERKLEHGPWNVTVISYTNKIAVTLPKARAISFLTFGKSLSLSRSLKTAGKCRGLDYCKGRLFVSFECPPKIQILDLQGAVIRTFDNQLYKRTLFAFPMFVCVDSNDCIIVSDRMQKTVVKLGADGTFLGTYKSQSVLSLSGIAILADNCTLVCNGNDVSVITKDCANMTCSFCVFSTLALCVNERSGVLYVSSFGSETLRKFAFT